LYLAFVEHSRSLALCTVSDLIANYAAKPRNQSACGVIIAALLQV
jgi:hypothetical protein